MVYVWENEGSFSIFKDVTSLFLLFFSLPLFPPLPPLSSSSYRSSSSLGLWPISPGAL